MVLKKIVTSDVYKSALENGTVEKFFSDSKFFNVVISNIGKVKKIKNTEFHDCIFKGCFMNCEFQNVVFENCILFDNESEFINCEFKNCIKKACDF